MRLSALLSAAVLASSGISAHAIEAPLDDAAPPRMAGSEGREASVAKPTENPVAAPAHGYLGVLPLELPEALVQHLKLKSGEGVLLGSVMPGGPADGKLMQNDIVLGIGGKPVGSPEEFSENISSRKPEETVVLELMRNGTRTTAEVALGKRPVALGARGDQAGPLPKGRGPGIEGEAALEDRAAGIAKRLKDLRNEMMQRGLGAVQGMEEVVPLEGGIHRMGFSNSSSVRISDDEGSVQMEKTDDSSVVTVYDKSGKVVWTGPWDTPEDKNAAPAELMDRIKAVTDAQTGGGGIRLRLQRGGAAGNGIIEFGNAFELGAGAADQEEAPAVPAESEKAE